MARRRVSVLHRPGYRFCRSAGVRVAVPQGWPASREAVSDLLAAHREIDGNAEDGVDGRAVRRERQEQPLYLEHLGLVARQRLAAEPHRLALGDDEAEVVD